MYPDIIFVHTALQQLNRLSPLQIQEVRTYLEELASDYGDSSGRLEPISSHMSLLTSEPTLWVSLCHREDNTILVVELQVGTRAAIHDDLDEDIAKFIDQLQKENAELKCKLARAAINFVSPIPSTVAFDLVESDDPINVWREYRGLSVTELSEVAGVSEAELLIAESGAAISPHVLGRIAKGLRVNVSDLISPFRD